MQNTNQKGLVGTQITAGEYNPRGRAIYAPTEDVLTHEQAHASKAYPQENRIQEILGGENKATTDYLDRPTEVYSRLMDFREINNIDPNQVWDKKALKELKKTGTDVDLLNRYKDDQLLDLFNTVADIGTERNYDQPQYLAEGGEVGDPDDEFIQAVNTDANSNLYYWMRSALKPFSRIDPNTDKLTKYYSKPTEQKAYMNQLREFMYANKMIDTRDQIVTPDLIKQAISKLPKGMQSIKKASEQFKSMRSYTKWFNTIPLLGVGAVGANKYFTSNENRD